MIYGFAISLVAAVVALFISPLHAIALAILALSFGIAVYGTALVDALSIYISYIVKRDNKK